MTAHCQRTAGLQYRVRDPVADMTLPDLASQLKAPGTGHVVALARKEQKLPWARRGRWEAKFGTPARPRVREMHASTWLPMSAGHSWAFVDVVGCSAATRDGLGLKNTHHAG